MTIWKENIELDKMDPDFLSIRSMFVSGSIATMYQLVSYSPTKVSKLLGLNYSAYHSKLVNPGQFSVLHINVLAYAIQIDPNIIHDIIQNQIEEKIQEKMKKFKKTK
ncbi:hypothetical protein QF042_003748 [Pedobacter sp. W3I1]|uniref:hypothetical protein n=1 Tax=Pedobacter sp. W3I1 TaxID=3042291 RepID=UPI002788781C|nr:hypothetical protein [Pedobacter sp. W3I1]MDQ0640183.1 hypothetical protein [Pedobacter sp. W3I1]